ncbi:MAG TPA: hypothetical protein VK511_03970 [Gemmatimonadaceae bacterium]|nr:hypothetical protein [Gemmatimonadaceae bacterium]
MAAGDKKPPEKSDDESPAPKKPEVKVSSHDDMGVRVSRDLNASGPVARGYNSNMSKLNFSARAIPRAEGPDGDPALARPVVAPQVPAPEPPAAPAASPTDPATPDDGGVVSWLTGLFTRR